MPSKETHHHLESHNPWPIKIKITINTFLERLGGCIILTLLYEMIIVTKIGEKNWMTVASLEHIYIYICSRDSDEIN